MCALQAVSDCFGLRSLHETNPPTLEDLKTVEDQPVMDCLYQPALTLYFLTF
jgi:hypothetical protein